jgi:hypothetical protein
MHCTRGGPACGYVPVLAEGKQAQGRWRLLLPLETRCLVHPLRWSHHLDYAMAIER